MLRDFNTISPSAKSLLLMKGYSNIPFARRTAELISFPEQFIPDFENKDFTFWARTLHFEHRYQSINHLLADTKIKNILELSSGFSFRGLEWAKQNGVHYLDTDLPAVVETKKEFMPELTAENYHASGKLELLPLNACNEQEFKSVVAHFLPGEIAIVNEGLLMYLNPEEKELVCKIIHNILSERGGYWITSDVYLKNHNEKYKLKFDKDTREFFELHKLEENKFNDFKEAEAFFLKNGFVIDKEAKVNHEDLSVMKYFRNSLIKEKIEFSQEPPKMQATWRLRPVAN